MARFKVTSMADNGGGIPQVGLHDGDFDYTALVDPADGTMLSLSRHCGCGPEGGDLEVDRSSPEWGQATAAVLDELREQARRLAKMAPKLDEGASLAVARTHPEQHRNARVRRYVGIAHSDPGTAYFSSSGANTVAHLAVEADPLTEPPEAVDSHVRAARRLGDERDALVVVSGEPPFMLRYLRALREPDFVVFVAAENVLEAMGVDVADRGFEAGQPERTLDEILYPEFGAKPGPSYALTGREASAEEPQDAWGPPPSRKASQVELEPSHPPRVPKERPEPAAARSPLRIQQAARPRPPVGGNGGGAKTVQRHATHKGAIGAPTGIPPMGMAAMGFLGGGGPDPDDEVLAGNAAQFLRGGGVADQIEQEPPEAQELPVVAGSLVVDVADSRGRVASVEGDMAMVRFEGEDEDLLVPVSDLRAV